MNRISFFILAVLGVSLAGRPETVPLTLDEAITRARAESVEAAVALDELRSDYWEYRSYRADLLPEVTFDATLPSYSKQYQSYMNEDGSYTFVPTNYLEALGRLSVTQKIWPTGGTLSLSTSLDFLRQFSGDAYNRFMSVPVSVTLNQPIFSVNETKWSRRIEPVRYREAKAAFLSQTEDVALTAIQYFFSLLLARENSATARQNLANAEKLYSVAREKCEMGQISKNDLLQMELNLLNARSTLTDCLSEEHNAMFQLATFLGFPDETVIEPVLPGSVPRIEITYNDVLEKSLERNKFALSLQRRQLEADYLVAQAKGNLREINLSASVGYTGEDRDFPGAYRSLRDNQVVSVGVSIPLLDWGKRRGRVKVAESNREVVAGQLRQEMQSFRQNIFILCERFNNQQSQLDIALRSDTIARRRYDTNVETYLVGRISTLDLNDSQSSKDAARRQYIQELYSYWSYFYQIRSLTLWDYTTASPLEINLEKIKE